MASHRTGTHTLPALLLNSALPPRLPSGVQKPRGWETLSLGQRNGAGGPRGLEDKGPEARLCSTCAKFSQQGQNLQAKRCDLGVKSWKPLGEWLLEGSGPFLPNH